MYNENNGIVFQSSEGEAIAQALGSKKVGSSMFNLYHCCTNGPDQAGILRVNILLTRQLVSVFTVHYGRITAQSS